MSETTNLVRTLGTYKNTIYRNDHTGFCVFRILAADEGKLKSQNKHLSAAVTCAGIVPEFRMETPLYIEGVVVQCEYGYQLQIVTAKEKSWEVSGLTSYLCNICSGIGLMTANAVAEKYTDNLFDIIDRSDAAEIMSSEIPSLSYDVAETLRETIGRTRAQKAVYEEIHQHGGTWAAASKIVDRYGANALQELRNNPHTIGLKCGLKFETCDRVAKKAGKSAADPERIKQALLTAFEQEHSRGHVYTTESEVCKTAHRIIKKSAYDEVPVPSTVLLDALAKDDTFVFDVDDDGYEGVYLRWMYRNETETARQLQRLMKNAAPLNYDESIVDWAEKSCGIKYAPQQRESFKLIQKTGVAVVTGGPGTGKTTTVNGLISAYEKLNPNKIIRLCAPTGRAAQRMTESTGREAVTIHRLLEFRPFGNDTVYKNASDPIVADLIVVDEASMLDIELARIFLSAVKDGTLVLFIGDINQLPSVGPGDVLHDLIGSGKIPTVQLTTVYRQGSQSPIIVNAKYINEGLSYVMTNEDYHTDIFENAEAILSQTIALVSSLYDPRNPFDVQVLAPTHKGEAGVAMINNTLQQILNPPNGQPEVKYGSRVYRVGDKVILLNNNYSTGYFNGDIGIVTDASTEGVDVDICGKILHLSKAEMEDLNLAYAISIHKSQGSEFKHVIVALPERPANMLKRNLLYTAITRAKKTVYVLAEGSAYTISVNAAETGKRNTRLAYRIRKAFEEIE